jgi:hypothetical protein
MARPLEMGDDENSSVSSSDLEEDAVDELDSKIQEIVPSFSSKLENWISRITENKTLAKFTQRIFTHFLNLVKVWTRKTKIHPILRKLIFFLFLFSFEVLKVIVHWAWLPALLWFGSATAGPKYNIITVMFPFFDTPDPSQLQKGIQEEQMEIGVDDEGNCFVFFLFLFLSLSLSLSLSFSLSLSITHTFSRLICF